jgi:hypothetical protein
MRGVTAVEWRDGNRVVVRGHAATPLRQIAGS